MAVDCPICSKPVKTRDINSHIDSGCTSFIYDKEQQPSPPQSQAQAQPQFQAGQTGPRSTQKRPAADFFSVRAAKRVQTNGNILLTPRPKSNGAGTKRSFDEGPGASAASQESEAGPETGATTKPGGQTAAAEAGGPGGQTTATEAGGPGGQTTATEAGGPGGQPTAAAETGETKPAEEKGPGGQAAAAAAAAAAAQREPTTDSASDRVAKRPRTQQPKSAPLADRMRPQKLDEVYGQDLVGPTGVLRALIESGRLPSMILWGASGTGKTTIARCMARAVAGRFVELNATSAGVHECKRIFAQAATELALTGRKTVVFCDEMHRFSKAQQDVFLKPVEEGTVTLVAATTENPSFRLANALLSRCRVFTLEPLQTAHVLDILRRAYALEQAAYPPAPALVDDDLLVYLAHFADGDARTALNLLELALALTLRDGITSQDDIKAALTKTFVYDRCGDAHYDAISAFHKSVRGCDADAALYYLARMLQSGQDALFIARRMVVIASEDIGLADSSMLPLATAAYTAAQQIGLPEARIPLAHCAVALSLAPKSTRVYRALNNAMDALREPGVAALPVPLHLRNAPTRLMRHLGCGADYKYPPNYRDGRVKQSYLPQQLVGRRFLEDRDLGTEIDVDLAMPDA
ncbi:hypothetical protein CDD82_3606 [Ophiocordyceps australis]|uniref:UBZ4-type domain-containing protein n=1 Tax=Ophiocordyceps australis TaxID=1399860 RepID=A0A2C5ZB24_9HYPO|nr:hypothetical protein CDD82_3606 [Ophiocordyceps australis]